jgi:hypothetical protein
MTTQEKLSPGELRFLLIALVPVTVSGIVFELFLGHRHDYTGHFLAGYGASYAVASLWLKTRATTSFQLSANRSIVPICLACIFAGVITEATIFRIAKFDEIDFFSQSLGAVLALICALPFVEAERPTDFRFDQGLILGIVVVGIGAIYAVA